MTTVHQNGMRTVSFTKGAPDMILGNCTSYRDEVGVHPMGVSKRTWYMRRAEKMSASGGRVLGAAVKEGKDLSEKGMTFLGMAVLEDPVRPEVSGTVEEFRHAGVTTVMITGDHKDTALATARTLKIADSPSQCMTGAELDCLGDGELADKISEIRVFARVSPDHKVRIVRALKKTAESWR